MSTPSNWKSSTKFFAAVVAAASMSAAAYGQSQRTPLRVDVPFAFESGNRHLPAGVYTIKMEGENVTGVHGTAASDFAVSHREQNNQPAQSSKVVFRKYGDQYVLSEVWIAGLTSHTQCVETKTEKQMELASGAVPPETVVELAQLETSR
jgi:opacity protein-like surface antigen